MKVKFIAPKRYKNSEIQDLLSLSETEQKFTNDGPVKKLLEHELEKFLKISNDKSVVCVSNGTTALHALFYLFDKLNGKKLKWLTPAFTFPTPCVAGFNTTVCDISLDTYTIPETYSLDSFDGIILTNLYGSMVDIDYWVARCKKENKLCIFDNASSPMSMHDGINIMNFGDASFGSLHHTKLLGVGEGGFVIVSKNHYEEVNKICNFGFNEIREYDALSSNFKMSDITAAYTLSHIRNFNFFKHEKNQKELIERIIDLKSEKFKVFMFKNGTVFGNLPILFTSESSKEVFRELGIEANKYYKPIVSLPNAEYTFNRMINFPLNDQMTAADIDYIVHVLKNQ